MTASHFGLHYKHTQRIVFLYTILVFNSIMFQGCGTLSNGRGWGRDATLTPGWERIKTSAVNAVASPETWGPLAGALTLQIDDMDQRISDWASEKNPVFGSMKNAREWSNNLEAGSSVVYFITAMAAPSGDDASAWLAAKSKGLAAGLAAAGITGGSTRILKRAAGRTRPDRSDNKSFPSGHSSDAAAFTTLARRNLKSIPLSDRSRILAGIGIAGIAVGTGWARIEARAHYPADVLAGYSLGHFVSSFINDAFLGLTDEKAVRLVTAHSRQGIWLCASWSF